MTNDDKDLKPMIEKTECQECKALVSMNEYHTFSHCLIAKAYPDFWRSIVKDLTSKTTPQQPSEKKALSDGIREVNKMTQEIFDAASEKKALSMEDIKSIAIKATRKIKYPDGKTEYSLWLSNDEWTTIAQAIFAALPAQREVRYPEKEYCGKINTALHNDNCEECKYHKLRNKLIDKMKKLNGG